MPFATATLIGAVGAAAAIGGTAVAYEGQQAVANAQKEQEKIKQTQMNLDAARQTRDIARRATLARSQALVNATNQGAQSGSGLQGGQAQISGQEASGYESLNQNQQLGNAMFSANRTQTDASSMANFGQGMQGFGSQLYQNRDMLGRVGSYITGNDSWF